MKSLCLPKVGLRLSPPSFPLENIETLIERANQGDQKALCDLVSHTLLKFSCSHPLTYVTSFAVERAIAVV